MNHKKIYLPIDNVLNMCLCYRCANDFRTSGYILVKKGLQDIKNDCDYCKMKQGLTYGVFSKEQKKEAGYSL